MLRNLIFALAAPILTLSIAAEDLTLEQAKAKHAAADKLLNASYAKAKSTLPEHLFAELQEDQRSWLSYRDYRSEQAAGFDGGAEEGKEKSTVRRERKSPPWNIGPPSPRSPRNASASSTVG